MAYLLVEDPEFREGRLSAYTDVLSREELVGLVEFYRSPVGQKALVKIPEITRERGAVVQKIVQRYQPEFNEQVREILKPEDAGSGDGTSD